jgi:hypothetical protein
MGWRRLLQGRHPSDADLHRFSPNHIHTEPESVEAEITIGRKLLSLLEGRYVLFKPAHLIKTLALLERLEALRSQPLLGQGFGA